MKETTHTKEVFRDLFASQRLAVLGTQLDGHPYLNLVAFAASEDLKDLLFATTRATRKFANLSGNANVSLLVDNRSNAVSDFSTAMAVTATGTAEEIDGREKERFLEIYLAKHPYLVEFVSAPTCALLRVRVERYYVVSRFQNVMEVHLRP